MATSKYRSGLEEKFHKQVPNALFEPFDLPYTVYRKYIPDFVLDNILIECKGFFRVGDTQKYKAIRDSIKGKYELIFVFTDSKKKLRKGSKMTLGQWCDKEGFKHFTLETLEGLREYL